MCQMNGALSPTQPIARHAWIRSEQAALVGLVSAACGIELILLLGWLPILSLAKHPGLYSPSDNTLTWAIGDSFRSRFAFGVLFLGLIILYLASMALARSLRGSVALALAFIGSIVFGITMLMMFPAGSRDVFHNIIDGRLLWVHHLNPIVTPPDAITADPLYRYITDWQSSPSAYGPLWFLITGPATFLAGVDRDRALVVFKALPLLFEMVSLGLIARIASRIDPRQTVTAVICLGWSPLALWEIAGNGHNDIVMMAFVLLAILLMLSKRWPLAFPALACSVLVKYVSAILFPVFIVWVLRRYGRRAVLPLIYGLVGALIIAAVAFAPFWVGARTLAQLHAQQNQLFLSLAAMLTLSAGRAVANSPQVLAVKAGLMLAFLLGYGLVLLQIRPKPSGGVESAIIAVFLYLLLMTWWFFPWYVVWVLALGAIVPGSAQGRLAVLFSITALFYYLAGLNVSGSLTVEALTFFLAPLIIFLPPLEYMLKHVWRPWQRPIFRLKIAAPFSLGESGDADVREP